jgi:hypothetical protein
MELSEELKLVFIETAKVVKGAARRLFQARIVKVLGSGGQQRAETELGWNRGTIRKGQHELESGVTCLDVFSARGRKRAEDRLPKLEQDVHAILKSQSQIDPSFKTERLYIRLSAAAVREQLIIQKGYTDAELPGVRTLSTKLNAWGYPLRKVAKSKPQKKIPETDAIFDEVHRINTAADKAEDTLRISLDAKAPVKIGEFSRHGYSRVEVDAADHDFKPEQIVTPFGFLLPKFDDVFFYFSTSKVTSDFIVDCFDDLWTNMLQPRFPKVKLLVLNLDNGPENHSRRTQFIKRIVEFVMKLQITVQLAYYPPYHSKYNPVERCWGCLENHRNGALLDELDTALNFAQSMTWNGKHPIVKLITNVYETGVRLTKSAMDELETQIKRLPTLEKWFVEISPTNLTADV